MEDAAVLAVGVEGHLDRVGAAPDQPGGEEPVGDRGGDPDHRGCLLGTVQQLLAVAQVAADPGVRRGEADQHSPGQHQRRSRDPGDERGQHPGGDQQRGGPVALRVPAQAAQLGGVGAEHHVRRTGTEPEAEAARRRLAP